MTETSNNTIITGKIESNTIWPQFGIPAFSLSEDVDVSCNSVGRLAEAVLDEYGMDYLDTAAASTGGDLEDLDIKRMDAMTINNLSLIERAAKSGKGFIEPIVNVHGEVEFVEIKWITWDEYE